MHTSLSKYMSHLKPLNHQAAGHAGAIFTQDDDDLNVLKPFEKNEFEFYESLFKHNENEFYNQLKQFLPKYYGIDVVDNQKVLKLENLMYSFNEPCVMDLKIGICTAGENATKEKREAMHLKDINTTTHTLGLRICGMQVR